MSALRLAVRTRKCVMCGADDGLSEWTVARRGRTPRDVLLCEAHSAPLAATAKAAQRTKGRRVTSMEEIRRLKDE